MGVNESKKRFFYLIRGLLILCILSALTNQPEVYDYPVAVVEQMAEVAVVASVALP